MSFGLNGLFLVFFFFLLMLTVAYLSAAPHRGGWQVCVVGISFQFFSLSFGALENGRCGFQPKTSPKASFFDHVPFALKCIAEQFGRLETPRQTGAR